MGEARLILIKRHVLFGKINDDIVRGELRRGRVVAPTWQLAIISSDLIANVLEAAIRDFKRIPMRADAGLRNRFDRESMIE